MLRNLVLTLMAAAPPASLSRTLTTDDILSLSRLQGVQISPDGSHVAYLVEEPNDCLRHFGVPSKLIVYPRDGHVPRERNHMTDQYARVTIWLREYL